MILLYEPSTPAGQIRRISGAGRASWLGQHLCKARFLDSSGVQRQLVDVCVLTKFVAA